MMKQPALGIRLSALRKARGLTQEELVERCNVSVRTIQRIEAGEVTPRSYTVRLLLTAMGYPFETVVEPDGSDIDDSRHADVYATEQNANDAVPPVAERHEFPDAAEAVTRDRSDASLYLLAMMAGIVYLIVGSWEGVAEYMRIAENVLLFGRTGYIIVKIVALLSYILFVWGFLRLGSRYNTLLRIASIFAMIITLAITTYDIASLFNDAEEERPFVMGASAVSAGAVAILFGVGIRNLQRRYGEIASIAGILEIIAGCCLVTVVLALPGLMIMLIAEILEVLLLYRAMMLARAGRVSV